MRSTRDWRYVEVRPKLLSILFSVLGLSVHLSAATPTLVLKNVAVIDIKSGNVRPGMTVVISGTHIIAVGKKVGIPKGAVTVDGSRKFLIPGLWDMHVHVLRPDRFSSHFQLLIANGVTGIRD